MNNTLSPGVIYHIYNRGINHEAIFREPRNYEYFIRLYAQHVAPAVDTYAYCLLSNHFHLLTRIKDSPVGDSVSQRFSNFFNAYSKGFNTTYQRSGGLFMRPFRRIPVTDDRYFLTLISYIHHNPQKHGFVDDFRDWPYSSYGALLSNRPTQLMRDEVLNLFGGVLEMVEFHQYNLAGLQVLEFDT